MKNWLLLFFLSPLLCVAQDPSLRVTGKITGLKEGGRVYLIDINRPTDTLAKGKVSKGVFTLKGTLKEPSLVNLILPGQQPVMTFFDNAVINISGAAAKPAAFKYTGSKVPVAFQEFKKTFDPLFEKVMRINSQLEQGLRTDSVMMAMQNTRDSIQITIDRFIAKHPASPVSAFLLAATYQLSEDVLRTDQRLTSLKPSALENMYGIFLKESVAEAKLTAIGSTAMDFTQADTSGTPVTLSSFRGKYVLLDFWASWCGPCRQENPNVVATYQKFNAKNFTVLGVSLDRPGQKDKWIQAIHADNLTWTHVSDLQFWNNAVAQQYRVQSIPQNLLIGPDGRIVAKNLRGPALEAKLCEVLGCN
jgi:peroxiredoxin